MTYYNYIYGSEVSIQCQQQINIEPWDGQVEFVRYLDVIKKEIDYFKYYCKPRGAVICTVDESLKEELEEPISKIVGTHKNAILKAQKRAIGWSIEQGKLDNVSKKGHGKQILYVPHETFCAKYQGMNFQPPDYSSTNEK